MKNNENTRTNNKTTNYLKNIVLVLIIIILAKVVIRVWMTAEAKEKVKDTLLQFFEDDQTMNEVKTETTGTFLQTEKKLTEKTVKEVTNKAEKMVTQEVTYEKVGHYSKSKKVCGKNIPLTKDDVLFEFEATIYVGVNLENAEYDVDNENKVITVTLPKAEIIAHEIDEDSFAYHTVKNSPFTSSGMDEYVEEINELKTVKEKEVDEDGKIYEAAEEQAKSTLMNLLLMNDETKEYRVEFEMGGDK